MKGGEYIDEKETGYPNPDFSNNRGVFGSYSVYLCSRK